MKLVTVLLVACLSMLFASAQEPYTHGVAGSFSKLGRVRWEGFGYWSKTTRRWKALRQPIFGGSASNAASQIAHTSDGGAIVVGGFTAINGRQAAGVAYYDATADDWFPANEVGLYKVTGGPDDSTGACRANQGTQGVDYFLKSGAAQAAVHPMTIGSALTPLGTTEQTLSNPVAVDPNTGQSQVVTGATDPSTQQERIWHTEVGKGRAIIADATTADVFYVFGNFEAVGLDVNAVHNRDLTAAGFVKFTYDPTTKKITPSAIGTGYTTRKRTDVTDALHPRHCGHSGATRCDVTTVAPNAGCPSESPHNSGNAVAKAGMTNGAAGRYFFIQETGTSDVYRWKEGGSHWVNVVVNDDGGPLTGVMLNTPPTVRTGTGQTISGLTDVMNGRFQFNLRRDNGATRNGGASGAASQDDFNWQVSQDQTTLWVFRKIQPFTAEFGSTLANDGSVAAYSTLNWADGVGANKAYFGGFKSTDSGAIAFDSAFSSANFPKDEFRDMPASPTNPVNSFQRPIRTSQGVRTTGSLAVTKDESLNLVAHRFPGGDAVTFQTNRYAATEHMSIRRVSDAATKSTIVDGGADGTIRWAAGSRPGSPANDDNGNPKMSWEFQYTDLSAIHKLKNGDIYIQATQPIYHDPILATAPGHLGTQDGRRFKKTYGQNWMVLNAAGTWESAFGGGMSSTPISFWSRTIAAVASVSAAEERVYVYDLSSSPKWNFNAQSGVSVFHGDNQQWVDPFASWRLVGETSNFYDGSTAADVGTTGSANIIHIQPSESLKGSVDYIVAGSFSYIGDVHYGSIVVWDGTTPGAGFKSAGSPTTGLYIQTTSSLNNKRWIQELAPTPINRKVSQGTINVMTNDGARLFVGGTFDRSSNDVTSDKFLRNIATMSDYSDVTAEWVDVDGGCGDSTIRQMIVFNKELYVAGSFDNCGSESHGGIKRNIARISTTLGATDHWQSLGTGVQGTVYALVEWNSKLMVAGTFSSVDNSGYTSVASWDGKTWGFLNNGCNGPCENNKLSVSAASVSRAFLSVADMNVRSLLATDRLWAVANSGLTTEDGASTSSREVIYYDGTGWFRVSRGRMTTGGADSYNGYLAVNGSDGTIIVGNGDLQDADMNNWLNTAGTGNMITIGAAAKDNAHHFPFVDGLHNANGQITHFAGASSLSFSIMITATIAIIVAALI